MTAFFFPDNTALINFHIIARWDLLQAAVNGAGRWCGSVSRECRESETAAYPGMFDAAAAIFGEPIYPEPTEHVDARVIRSNMADPTDDAPTRHLGEAETIAIARARFGGSRFITDDRSARDMAAAEDIRCYGTGDLLVVAERSLGLISGAQRQALEQTLRAADRTIRYFVYGQ